MISKSSFQERLQEVIDSIGAKEVRLDLDLLKTYCGLVGFDYSHFQARNLVPLGFLMTFTSSIFSEMFVSFLVTSPHVIKGVIHSSSKVESVAPFTFDPSTYREKLEIRKVEEKSGKKGNYFVVDLEVILTNANDVKVASDIHQFFLRI